MQDGTSGTCIYEYKGMLSEIGQVQKGKYSTVTL